MAVRREHRTIAILTLVVLAVVAAGIALRSSHSEGSPPAGPPPPVADPAPTGVLAGQVTSSTGQALSEVRVTVWHEGPGDEADAPEGAPRHAETLTNARGEFRFEGLAAGRWWLNAARGGFAPRKVAGLLLEESSGLERLSVVLTASEGPGEGVGAVVGRVTDRSGRPVERAMVRVQGEAGAGRMDVYTNADGEFVARPLLPGQYAVVLRKTRFEQRGGSFTESSARKTRFVSLAPGQTLRVDFTGSGRLTGVVLTAEGDPLAGVIVRVGAADIAKGYHTNQTRTGEDGRFVIEDVGAGPHHVEVQSTKPGDSFSVRVLTVDLTGADQDILVRLSRTELSGTVTLSGDGPPPPSDTPVITVVKLQNLVKVRRPSGQEVEQLGSRLTFAWPDGEGRFRFRGVAPGHYRLIALRKGYRRYEKDIGVEAGEYRRGMDIRLEPLRPGFVHLTVTDPQGAPIVGLRLWLKVGEDVRRNLLPEIPGPGIYVVNELETGTFEILLDRTGLEKAWIKISVVEGRTTRVETTMAPKGAK